MERRKQWVPWMDSLDERILTYLGQLSEGFDDLPPAENISGVHLHIAKRESSFEKSLSTFSRRLQRLEKRGYLAIAPENENYYFLTEKGERYLSGDLDPEEVEDSPPYVK